MTNSLGIHSPIHILRIYSSRQNCVGSKIVNQLYIQDNDMYILLIIKHNRVKGESQLYWIMGNRKTT